MAAIYSNAAHEKVIVNWSVRKLTRPGLNCRPTVLFHWGVFSIALFIGVINQQLPEKWPHKQDKKYGMFLSGS